MRWPRRSATLAPCAGRRLRGRPGAARAAHRAAARQRSIRLPPRAHWHRARAALRARQPQRRTATMPHRIYYSDKYYDANDYEYRCAPPPRRARPRRALHRGLTIGGLFCGQACHPAEGHSEEDPEEQAACRDRCGSLRARARRSCRRPAGRKRCRCSQTGRCRDLQSGGLWAFSNRAAGCTTLSTDPSRTSY